MSDEPVAVGSSARGAPRLDFVHRFEDASKLPGAGRVRGRPGALQIPRGVPHAGPLAQKTIHNLLDLSGPCGTAIGLTGKKEPADALGQEGSNLDGGEKVVWFHGDPTRIDCIGQSEPRHMVSYALDAGGFTGPKLLKAGVVCRRIRNPSWIRFGGESDLGRIKLRQLLKVLSKFTGCPFVGRDRNRAQSFARAYATLLLLLAGAPDVRGVL